jgi:lipoprotein
MKTKLTWALLLTMALTLASCGSKSKDEPKPTPPTPPNNIGTVDDNDADGKKALAAPIYFRIPKGQEFKLQVKGAKDTKLIGAKTTAKSGIYTAGTAGIVGIEGTLEALALTADGITEFKVAKATASLKKLILLTASGGGQTVSSIDLTNAPELTYLWLAGHVLETLDLTKQTKLVELGLGSFGAGDPFNGKERSSNYKKVSLATNNVIERIVTRTPLRVSTLDLDNLPKLRFFLAQSPQLEKASFAKSNNLEVVYMSRFTAGQPVELTLENKPNLKDISLIDVVIPKVKLHNLPALSSQSNISGIKATKSADFAGIPSSMLPSILGKFSPQTVETLTLSGSDVTKLDISAFAALTKLNLKGTGLSEAELINTIKQLKQATGKLFIESSRYTTNVQRALSDKGWTAETN